MANLSEVLAGEIAVPAPPAPGWLALLAEPEGFRAGAPFAPPPPAAPAPEPEPAPAEPPGDPAAEALARAFAEGEAAGRAAAAAEAAAQAAHQRALRLAFHALDEAALGVLAEDLAATVIALCAQTLEPHAVDRDSLLARCRAAAARIGGAADALTLHLHPEDMALMGEGALAAWRLAPDAALERGSVVITGPDGAVSDGPAEWRRAIAAAVRG